MIHWHIHEHLLKREAGFVKAGDKIIELGEQYINIDQINQHSPENPLLSRNFYINRETISIDIEPHFEEISGTQRLDLSKNISEYQDYADVVTDFGTLEHVKSLYSGLKNVFNFLKIGGVAMHVNPLSGGYAPNHGFHYFTEEFWKAFCALAKLKIEYIDIKAAYHNTETGNELYCVYKKTEQSKFPAKKAFDHLYKLHIRKS